MWYTLKGKKLLNNIINLNDSRGLSKEICLSLSSANKTCYHLESRSEIKSNSQSCSSGDSTSSLSLKKNDKILSKRTCQLYGVIKNCFFFFFLPLVLQKLTNYALKFVSGMTYIHAEKLVKMSIFCYSNWRACEFYVNRYLH